MVSESDLKSAVKDIIQYYASFKVTDGENRYQVLLEDEDGIYQLKLIGWNGTKRQYGLIIDIEVVEEKIWIHYDGTEDGVAVRLEDKGIPKEKIVLGWLSPTMRQFSDYAKA